ncbi:sulfhydryl oxidase 1-like [Lycorma delicatula]|uniref:sulfhydryl oxidase 1-like n=1 Tax=Lycorma delicatula TaxID=130591 RepID=UPI003F51A24E
MGLKGISCLTLVLLFFVVSLSDEKVIAPENTKLYHDVVSGLGLYNNFKQIFELTTSNFKDVVYSKVHPRTWIVEFYNSWCGHCHRFAPIFKTLAVDIYNWRDVVAIGAVDCANDSNNQLCRDYEIMAYPSIKVFPINSPDNFLGDSFEKDSAAAMAENIIEIIQAEDASGNFKVLRENLNLKPFNDSNLNILWFGVPLSVHYIFLVFIDPVKSPHLGSKVALDLYSVKNIEIRTVYNSNKGLLLQLPNQEFPGVYVVERNNNYRSLPLKKSENERDSIVETIGNYLNKKGINIPIKEKPDIENGDFDVSDAMQIMKFQEEIKKKLHSKDLSDVVFQVDIEGAVKYSLYHEIAGHKNIEGEKLVALKNYVTVLSKYFPIGVDGRKFFSALKQVILPKTVVYGKEFAAYVKNQEILLNNVFLPSQDWIGCRGSQPHFRGYPCSLWTLFHTLTVQAYQKRTIYPNSFAQEVLNAMVGYIKYFFGCTDCSEHFQQMAVTMPGNVSTVDSSILWLWQAHNAANSRLAGDVTEDPEHKKIQFPSVQTCPKCRDDNQDWVFSEVLEFLKSMYTNISYVQWSDINVITTTVKPLDVAYSKRLRHEIIGNDNGFITNDNSANKSSWDFNIFDISLCVVLYVSSVIILLLVCIKFIMRKNYKKKNSFDLYHGKV